MERVIRNGVRLELGEVSARIFRRCACGALLDSRGVCARQCDPSLRVDREDVSER